MPPSPRRARRRLKTLARDETAGAAVENALILALTAVMLCSVKAGSGVTALFKPTQQAFAALIRALS